MACCMLSIKKFAIFLIVFMPIAVSYFWANKTQVKSHIDIAYKDKNVTLKNETTYILKDVEFRGYLFQKKGIEVWYIDRDKKERFFMLDISNELLDTMKKKAPHVCRRENNRIYTKFFIVSIPKVLKKQTKIYCYRAENYLFLFSAPNEKSLQNAFLSYVELKRADMER